MLPSHQPNRQEKTDRHKISNKIPASSKTANTHKRNHKPDDDKPNSSLAPTPHPTKKSRPNTPISSLSSSSQIISTLNLHNNASISTTKNRPNPFLKTISAPNNSTEDKDTIFSDKEFANLIGPTTHTTSISDEEHVFLNSLGLGLRR